MTQVDVGPSRRRRRIVPMPLPHRLCRALNIAEHYLFRITRANNPTLVQPQRPAAQAFHGGEVVAHEQYGSAVACYLTHLSQTFFLESSVANCEDLIHQKNLR